MLVLIKRFGKIILFVDCARLCLTSVVILIFVQCGAVKLYEIIVSAADSNSFVKQAKNRSISRL